MARHRAEDAETPPDPAPPAAGAPVGLSVRLFLMTLAVGVAAAVVLSVLAHYRP